MGKIMGSYPMDSYNFFEIPNDYIYYCTTANKSKTIVKHYYLNDKNDILTFLKTNNDNDFKQNITISGNFSMCLYRDNMNGLYVDNELTEKFLKLDLEKWKKNIQSALTKYDESC